MGLPRCLKAGVRLFAVLALLGVSLGGAGDPAWGADLRSNCLAPLAAKLLGNLENQTVVTATQRRKMSPEQFEKILDRLFEQHPKLKKSPYYQMMSWFKGPEFGFNHSRLAAPHWQYFINRFLLKKVGVDPAVLDEFLWQLWPQMSPKQHLTVLQGLDEAISTSALLKIENPTIADKAFLDAYGISLKEMNEFAALWKPLSSDERRLFLWTVVSKDLPLAVEEMGGIPYHRGIRVMETGTDAEKLQAAKGTFQIAASDIAQTTKEEISMAPSIATELNGSPAIATPDQALSKIESILSDNVLSQVKGGDREEKFRSIPPSFTERNKNSKYFTLLETDYGVFQDARNANEFYCSLLAIAGGLSALVCVANGDPLAAASSVLGPISLYQVTKYALNKHPFKRGIMSRKSAKILNEVDRLATPPSPELTHQLVAAMSSPAEVHELFWRLAENKNFPGVFKKPKNIEQVVQEKNIVQALMPGYGKSLEAGPTSEIAVPTAPAAEPIPIPTRMGEY